MQGIDERVLSVWRRTLSLGWPIAIDQTLSTLMRTVDLIVTGLFSPIAVAAVGIADLYGQIPLRIGLGLGAGTIALSSQDTGRGAEVTRDQAITQGLLLGALAGIPIVVVGLTFTQPLIAVLGAESAVVRAGGVYLSLILVAAPMRIVLVVGARALQGTGDTRTPMVVNVFTNVLNILLTVALGLGLWALPTLGIVGVGIATAVSETLGALAMSASIASPYTEAGLVYPRNLTLTRQLVRVSVPNFAEGMSTALANFPFNALVLLFGTEANAAYHIGRRIYRQVIGPLYRAVYTVASIVVGQRLGEGDQAEARFSAKAILWLSLLVHGVVGVSLFAAAGLLVQVFTQDPTTIGHAIDFTRAYAVSMLFIGIFYPLAGALVGAGDTRTPFFARLLGVAVFLLGASYLLGVTFGFGLLGIYVGVVLSFVCWAAVVSAGFYWGGWQGLAERMMAERSTDEGSNP